MLKLIQYKIERLLQGLKQCLIYKAKCRVYLVGAEINSLGNDGGGQEAKEIHLLPDPKFND